MKELSVYVCPRCGRYGYYQLTRNAVCPCCNIKMLLCDIRYPDFVRLDAGARDDMLVLEILSHSLPGDTRAAEDIPHPNRQHPAGSGRSHRELAAALTLRFQELSDENKKLNETVTWMHQTIWDLLARNKALQKELEQTGSQDTGASSGCHATDPPNPSAT